MSGTSRSECSGAACALFIPYNWLKFTFNNMLQPVTIAVFRFPTDPDFVLFTTELERAGIRYVCPEQNQLAVDPLLSIGLGGLRVMTDAADEQQARAIYEELIGVQEIEPDEADLELERLKAADEKRFTQNYYRSLLIVGLGLLALLGIAYGRSCAM